MNEDFEWVKRCIFSCTNEFQLGCIPGMIDLFEIKHIGMIMGAVLRDVLNEKYKEIKK